MKIGKTFKPKTRADWRRWFEKNHDKEKEVWLLNPKKSSGVDRIPYNDTVEEALCFGWIDSTNKTFDTDHTAQKFTPRRPKTAYSQTNIERLRRLVKEGRVIKRVLDSLGDILTKEFVIPQDILRAIKSDKNVWNNFQKFSLPYKRIRIAYIDDARKLPEEFKKRLKNFIEKTRQNKNFGYGGIEKYF